jgi:hypothetical protein
MNEKIPKLCRRRGSNLPFHPVRTPTAVGRLQLFGPYSLKYGSRICIGATTCSVVVKQNMCNCGSRPRLCPRPGAVRLPEPGATTPEPCHGGEEGGGDGRHSRAMGAAERREG